MDGDAAAGRSLSLPGWALVIVVYLAIIQDLGLLLAMLVHGLWDFSLLSSQLGPDPQGYAGSALIILLQVVLIVLLLVRRHRIEPAPAAAPAAA